jgi:hypothetical protein
MTSFSACQANYLITMITKPSNISSITPFITLAVCQTFFNVFPCSTASNRSRSNILRCLYWTFIQILEPAPRGRGGRGRGNPPAAGAATRGTGPTPNRGKGPSNRGGAMDNASGGRGGAGGAGRGRGRGGRGRGRGTVYLSQPRGQAQGFPRRAEEVRRIPMRS